MPESAFFSGLSAIIPMRADEDRDWVTDLVRTARGEASEVLIVIERGVDPLSVRPALGSSERTKILMQRGDTKSDALNLGLLSAVNQHVVFLDADLQLESGQIGAVREMLEENEFVSVGYGLRVPNFVPLGFVSGWFFGARRSVFVEVGGWSAGYLEDVETLKAIARSGHKIAIAPFTVKLRRPVRRPATKFLSVLASFGKRP